MHSIVAITNDVITLLENGVPIQIHTELHIDVISDIDDPLVISATNIR